MKYFLGQVRAIARSENLGGGVVVLGGENVPPPLPGGDRVNCFAKKWGTPYLRQPCVCSDRLSTISGSIIISMSAKSGGAKYPLLATILVLFIRSFSSDLIWAISGPGDGGF